MATQPPNSKCSKKRKKSQICLDKQCPIGWYRESTNSNKCIKFVTEVQPWFGAKFDCSTLGNNSTLLSIDQAFEDSEICQVGQAGDDRCTQFYTGLFNSGNGWQWSDGDTSAYRDWKSGFPTSDSTKGCAAFDRKTCKWFNESCDTPQCYICQQYI
uniref:C-type lectin domain-containing protein n=1 Tax=Acrobeloides nanus TaxID=290746 RepID=A0A914DCI0_9BILA